ncbi:alpha/beta hydrolase-fold protein [Corynebacterium oculi]|uniref:Acyl-CoA:diacylglycerol acyltransferase n=1 Tax=Corynebacterium oculi TaxID=1544416 RepID=A0A0Q0Z1K2_9CORY|nr:alpha/beta hydrolase-fold protein [Corynebacterium oculi]KQB83068.1 putative esterase [Corynebacterium oculi]
MPLNRRSFFHVMGVGAAGGLLAACGDSTSSSSSTTSPAASAADAAPSTTSGVAAEAASVPSLEELVAEVKDSFTQATYRDEQTGRELAYNVFLPRDYDPQGSYPLVHFIGDSSTVSTDPTTPLAQYGALIWASEVTQAQEKCIVVVPAYTETVLDDHDGYTTTEWVDVTARFLPWLQQEYAVDPQRIYGTGQSMGCMIHLVLGGKNPDLFTAFMFVDGQWDPTQLSGLGQATFLYHVAGGDDRAVEGQEATKTMLTEAGVDYAVAEEEWDATADPQTLERQTGALFAQGKKRNFSSFVAGTVLEANPTGFDMEHMSSFEPAYKLTGARRWLLEQRS